MKNASPIAFHLERLAEGDFSMPVEVYGDEQTKIKLHALEQIRINLVWLAQGLEDSTDVTHKTETPVSLGHEVKGSWKDILEDLEFLNLELPSQIKSISKVIESIRVGDLSQTLEIEAQGEILELKNTINTMVENLSVFSSEVTRVAHEVGTEGQLGGQAYVAGVSGVWDQLTKDVNQMATLKTKGGRVLRVKSAESVTNEGLVTSVFAADVTSYLDVIRSLEEVKGGFQQLFETKFSGLVVIDYDSGVIIEANQRAHEILGSESLKGTHMRQFMAIGDYRSASNIATAYHEPVGSLELKIKSRSSDKSFPCAIYHETTEIFGKKCKLGWLMTGDTLDAVMVYQKILDSSPTSIVFYDSDGLIHHANPRAKRTFGKVLSGSNIADLVACESCQDIFFTPDGPLTEVDMIGRLGHFWGQLKVSKMRHHGRDMLLGVIEDISEKKNLTETLSKAMLEREELKLIKNRFVSIVSHEMRSPLTSIRSSLELIEMFLDDQKTLTTCRPHLERIDRNVTHMVEFLEDALLIGEMKTAESRFSPKKIILEDLRHQIYDSAESSGYAGRLDFSDDVWNQEIFCDSGLLLHAIQNLLGNAAKYSSSKAPILVDGKTADGMVILTVKDFGIGMTEDDVEKVFQQFHRGKNVGSVKGTGMGLLIVKNIMDLHAGWVKIDSDPGVGSQVSLNFPVVDTDVIIKNIADPTESFQDQPAFR
ncbi:MAG: ATP-binding protein [Rhodothermales bacterium]|nr:ATP-binding protein [Rhodothermales bacterium]